MGKKTNRTMLYTHLMRWEPLDVPGGKGRAWIKTLAKDDENGARTALIKFDPGFTQVKAVGNWPVDIYVLEGEIQCGAILYQKGTYHYRPAGTEYGPIDCPKGVTRLVFTADSKTQSSPTEVFIQDTALVPWQSSYLDDYDPTGTRSGIKVLRQDPVANISVLFSAIFSPSVRVLPDSAHIHDHIEEAFTLQGVTEDYLGEIDGHIRWVPGSFVCREPNASAHGNVTFPETPVVNFVRRGYAGKMQLHHRSGHNVSIKVPPSIKFAE